MHIFNIMFGRGLGGIEQSFLDYCRALKKEHITVTAIIHPKCALKDSLKEYGIPYIEFKNRGQWDLLARRKFKKLIHTKQPDALILHGNRAVSLCRSREVPSIGVTHNYSLKRIKKLDAILYTTEHLKQTLLHMGCNQKKLFPVPNMIDVSSVESSLAYKPHSPVIIGSMGRYVKKKGFATYLEALSILKNSGVEFKAVLAGTGPEEKKLHRQAKKLKLLSHLNFLPWVSDKNAFYQHIDIFCLPSLHEPFGIILLEALAAGKPSAVTLSEGPSEIVTDKTNALTCPIGDAQALAKILREYIKNPALASSIAEAASSATPPYTIDVVAKQLKSALEAITSQQKA